jgi:3-demethylubiquinone-9 3-methyltransferase
MSSDPYSGDVFNGEKVMSKIAPCLWFKDEAEEAANFYVSLLLDSRIDHVQKNVMDSPAGKVDSVLVIVVRVHPCHLVPGRLRGPSGGWEMASSSCSMRACVNAAKDGTAPLT